MIQRRLGRRDAAVNVVQDVQGRPRQPRAVQQPVEERRRLVVVAEIRQRADGQRRVAHPAETVVPVQVAADPLGQRRRRRRDDGARGRVVEQLERQHATNDSRPVGAVVVAAGDPAAPPGEGALHGLLRVGAQRRQHGRAVVVEAERQRRALARAQREAPLDAVDGDLGERSVGAQGVQAVAVLDPEAELAGGPDRNDPTRVVWAGLELDAQLDLAAHAFANAQDLVLGKQRGRLLLLGQHRHQIGEPYFAGTGRKRRDEDVRIVRVRSLRRERRVRRDQEMAAACAVEQRRQQRRAVEARPAQPVDRSGQTDQGGRPAVADDPVVMDERGPHSCAFPISCSSGSG
jgi:hypothetical protein